VHRELDEVSGEMCAAADEDLWFRNMRGVRTGIFLGCAREDAGCSGRVVGGVKWERSGHVRR
jgi:hypothetical protein